MTKTKKSDVKMEFSINRQLLRSAIASISPIVPRNSPYPFFNCLTFHANGKNKLTMEGGTSQSYIALDFECDVIKQGISIVNAEIFQNIISNAPDEPSTLHHPQGQGSCVL